MSAGGENADQSNNSSQSSLGAGGDPVAINEVIPEKFRVVNGEDFDLEGSSRKLAEGYSHLEKRTAVQGKYPESHEGYEIDGSKISEDFDAKAFMSEETNQSFLKAAHAKGMTNEQVQFVTEYALKEFAPGMSADAKVLSTEECDAQLKEVWKSDAEYNQNKAAAFKAFQSITQGNEEEAARLEEKFGDDPDFIKIMAKFGSEMKEDSAPNIDDVLQGETIEDLMASDAYKDPKHPNHQSVSKKVQQFYKSKYPDQSAVA